MSTLRTGFIFALVIFAAACSTEPSKPVAPPIASIGGQWELTIESSMGSLEARMTVIQNGKDIHGSIDSRIGNVDFTGTVNHKDVQFGYTFDGPGVKGRFDFSGTVDGGAMKGKTVLGPFGEGQFTAKRE
jgi:hypothetical protein